MIFSKTLTIKIQDIFIKENIIGKLNNEEAENAIKMKSNNFIQSPIYLPINLFLGLAIFYLFGFIAIKFLDYDKSNFQLYFYIFLSIIVLVSTFIFKKLKKPLNKTIISLKEKLNKKNIMHAFKLSLAEILNESGHEQEVINEAKNYILQLKDGKEELIFEKIKKEKILEIDTDVENNKMLKAYEDTSREMKYIKNKKIISDKDIVQIKIENKEKEGFNAKLEINKMLENI